MRTYLYALNQVQLTYLAAANLKGRRLKSSVLQQSNILLKLKGTGKQKAKRIKVRVISEFSRSRGRFLKTAAATIYNVSPWYIYIKKLIKFSFEGALTEYFRYRILTNQRYFFSFSFFLSFRKCVCVCERGICHVN